MEASREDLKSKIVGKKKAISIPLFTGDNPSPSWENACSFRKSRLKVNRE